MVSSILTAALLTAAPDFGFAFSNDTGEKLLALEPLAAPAEMKKVSCDGKVLNVTYLSEQSTGAKDTGRQSARNFSQVKGSLFKVMSGRVPADTQCLLGTDAAFASRKVLPVTATRSTKCDGKSAALAAKVGRRKVANCFSTGTFPGGKLAFVSFVRKGPSALVGVVLEPEPGAPAMRAFPATVDHEAQSCWRVDDGCQFDEASYRVKFVMTGAAGLELFALWGGAEGENAELLRVKGKELSAALSASRYWSAE